MPHLWPNHHLPYSLQELLVCLIALSHSNPFYRASRVVISTMESHQKPSQGCPPHSFWTHGWFTSTTLLARDGISHTGLLFCRQIYHTQSYTGQSALTVSAMFFPSHTANSFASLPSVRPQGTCSWRLYLSYLPEAHSFYPNSPALFFIIINTQDIIFCQSWLFYCLSWPSGMEILETGVLFLLPITIYQELR